MTNEIEHLDPHSLTPHPKNSRVHSPEQLQQLMASITAFGFNGAVVIDEDGVILAGHGRTEAVKRLGLHTIPCIRKIGLTDEQKRAYVIVDNQVALNSDWDEDVLAAEVEALMGTGFDLGDFGIPLAALESLEDVTPTQPADVRQRETRTTTAPPASDAEFQAEMARTDTAGELPIVPQYAEHHEAFIILCDNTIDEAWLRNYLGLDQVQKSYKDVKALRPNVLTVQAFRAIVQPLDSANAASPAPAGGTLQ